MIYYLILGLLLLGSVQEYILINNKNNFLYNQRINKSLFFFFAIFLTFFCALRGNIGHDYLMFQDCFRYCESIDVRYYKIEAGYVYLNRFFKYIYDNYYFMQFILSILMIYVVLKNINDNSDFPIFSLYIYFASYYLFIHFTAVRQCLAIAILIFGYRFIKERRLLLWCLIVFLAVQIHSTSIIGFPLYFTSRRTISLSTALILLFVAVFFEFFGDILVTKILTLISSFSFLPTKVLNLISIYNEDNIYSEATQNVAGVTSVIQYLMNGYLIYLCYKNGNRSQNYFLLNFLIGSIITAIGRNYGVLSRLTFYYYICGNGFLIYNILFQKSLLYNKTRLIQISLMVLFVMFFLIRFSYGFERKTRDGSSEFDSYVPYKTFFYDN